MKRIDAVIFLLFGVGAAGLILGARTAAETADLVRMVAAQDHRGKDLREEATHLGKELRAYADEVSKLEANLAQPKPSAQPAKPPQQLDPETAHQALRSWASLYYGQFVDRMHATAEQRHRFAELAAEYRVRMYDIISSARAHGLTAQDAGVSAMYQDEHDSFTEQVSSLLGQDAVAQLQNYERTSFARMQIGAFAGLLYDRDPIAPAEGDQLVAALSSNSFRANASPGGRTDALPGATNGQDPMTQALQIMTPAQRSVIQTLRASSVANQQLLASGISINIPLTSPGSAPHG